MLEKLIGKLIQKIESLVGSAAQKAESFASTAEQKIESFANTAEHKLESFGDSVERKLESIANSAEQPAQGQAQPARSQYAPASAPKPAAPAPSSASKPQAEAPKPAAATPKPAPAPKPAAPQPLKPEPAPFTAGGMTIITPANYTIGAYGYSPNLGNGYKQRPKDVTVLAGEGKCTYNVCDGLATSKVTELANALGVSYGSDWFAHRIAQELLKKVLGDKFVTPKRGCSCHLFNVAIFNDFLVLHEYINYGGGFSDSINRSCYVYQKA